MEQSKIDFLSQKWFISPSGPKIKKKKKKKKKKEPARFHIAC